VEAPPPPVVPAPEPVAAAPRPGLFRRVFGPRQAEEPAPTPEPEAPPPLPRATITRVAAKPEPPAPRIAEGTSPERLARAIGAEVGVDQEGYATVEMPGPFVPFSTAPRTATLARATPPENYRPPPPEPEPGPQRLDVDQIAETVIDRLRRELLIEREQAGGPMDLT
jgi:hypothetical protein